MHQALGTFFFYFLFLKSYACNDKRCNSFLILLSSSVIIILEATDGCSIKGGPEREKPCGEPVASFIVYFFLSLCACNPISCCSVCASLFFRFTFSKFLLLTFSHKIAILIIEYYISALNDSRYRLRY